MSFTSIRILSGALILAIVVAIPRRKSPLQIGGNWVSAFWMWVYAAGFSLAYVSLPVATGALILFGTVQATMIGWGIYKGERPTGLAWLGIALAAAGFGVLVAPGVAAPNALGAISMAVAGVAWGAYSLRGQTSTEPAADTTGNFALAIPFAIAGSLCFLLGSPFFTPLGAAYAAISGAITSGLGYIAWYAALPGLTSARAAVVQLFVPILAGFAGALVASEPITNRLLIAAAMTLGGIAMVVFAKRTPSPCLQGEGAGGEG